MQNYKIKTSATFCHISLALHQCEIILALGKCSITRTNRHCEDTGTQPDKTSKLGNGHRHIFPSIEVRTPPTPSCIRVCGECLCMYANQVMWRPEVDIKLPFTHHSLPYFLRQCSKLIISATLDTWQASWICLLLPTSVSLCLAF